MGLYSFHSTETVADGHITGRAGGSVCVCECILPYREHGGGEKTPCKKLQEDDHHSMVNTGLADSLRLRGGKQRWLGEGKTRTSGAKTG